MCPFNTSLCGVQVATYRVLLVEAGGAPSFLTAIPGRGPNSNIALTLKTEICIKIPPIFPTSYSIVISFNPAVSGTLLSNTIWYSVFCSYPSILCFYTKTMLLLTSSALIEPWPRICSLTETGPLCLQFLLLALLLHPYPRLCSLTETGPFSSCLTPSALPLWLAASDSPSGSVVLKLQRNKRKYFLI